MKSAWLFLLLVLVLPVAAENLDVTLGLRVDRTNISCSWDAVQMCDFVNQSNNGLVTDCGAFSNNSVQNCSYDYGFVNIDFGNNTYQYNHQTDIVTTITRSFPFEPVCGEGNYSCNFTIEDINSAVANNTCFNWDNSTANIDYDKIKGFVDAKTFSCTTADIQPCVDKAQESLDKCEAARVTCEGKTCSADNTWIYILLGLAILLIVGVGYLIRQQSAGGVE